MQAERIAVVGAGNMGAEIALSAALNGYEVYLKDRSVELARQGRTRAEQILAGWVSKQQLAEEQAQATLDRVVPIADYEVLADAALVIEAVFEDTAIKQQVFRAVEAQVTDTAVLATNTSSLSITEIAAGVNRPHQVIGLHFFSPASVMKLVEVVPGLLTAPAVTEQAMALMRSIGKEPVRCGDRRGFIVNRLLGVMGSEAQRIVEEGLASPEDIDKAMKLGCGHPLGPFKMADLVGLDLALSIANNLADEYGDRFKPSFLLRQRVQAGLLGRKKGRGWLEHRRKEGSQ